MTIEDQLGLHLTKIGKAPFLFVGSGLSRRYIGLETWEMLLRRFATGLSHPFEYYFGRASRDLPQTASLLAKDFYELWWKDPSFHTSRQAFQSSLSTDASCLKYEISQFLLKQHYVNGANQAIDDEVDLLKTATVDGVITTNWDTSLESIFPEFEVYVGQDQILFNASQGIAEIYKIHGCCSEPNSLVLTSEDYLDFNQRNPYLAAKLLTIFVEHPVIFLGYSLSDANITSIMRQIASCLTNNNIHALKDRLIFVEHDITEKGDSFESSITQVDGHSIPVTIIRTNNFKQIYRPLTVLKRRFSARLLRNMKKHVYELVVSSDPKCKLGVIDIEDDDSFKELDVVFGVGVSSQIGKIGYCPITRVDLMKDVLSPTSQYDPSLIVKDTLPSLLANTRFVPTFRYLNEAGRIGDDGAIDLTGLHDRVIKTARFVQSAFHPPVGYRREASRVQHELGSVKRVLEHYGENGCVYVSLLRPEQLDANELKGYLISNLKLVMAKRVHLQTYFRRLICFWDWLAFRSPKHT
jgi:hypothetical protein